MTRQTKSSPAAGKDVVFTCSAHDAQSVFLAGSFNDWDPKATPMEREKHGDWIATVTLEPGAYEYKFVVEDRWCCDPSVDDAAYAAVDAVPQFIRYQESRDHSGISITVRLLQRQGHSKRHSFESIPLTRNCASVLRHDLMGNGQSEARPTPLG